MFVCMSLSVRVPASVRLCLWFNYFCVCVLVYVCVSRCVCCLCVSL